MGGNFAMSKVKSVETFVVQFDGKLTIGVKLWTRVSRNEVRKLFLLLLLFFLSSMGYVLGIQLAKFGLLNDRTSSIYLNKNLKIPKG